MAGPAPVVLVGCNVKRFWFILLPIGLFCVLSAILFPTKVWIGSYTLRIKVQAKPPQIVERISCAFSFTREEAEWLASTDHREAISRFTPVNEFDGANYVARGRHSGRVWMGIESEYVWEKFVVVRVHFADGKQFTTVAEVPEEKERRTLTIDAP